LGKTATQRLVPGGHSASDYESLNDGIIWLYTMNAYLKKKAKSDELEKFEERFYTYLTKELSGKPWRAYYWTDHLLKTCKLSGDNKSKFEDLHKTLESDDVNVLYLEGREELAKFSKKYFVKVGPGSRHKHTTNDIKNAATKFIAKYGSIPRLKTIGIDLMKKTD